MACHFGKSIDAFPRFSALPTRNRSFSKTVVGEQKQPDTFNRNKLKGGISPPALVVTVRTRKRWMPDVVVNLCARSFVGKEFAANEFGKFRRVMDRCSVSFGKKCTRVGAF